VINCKYIYTFIG